MNTETEFDPTFEPLQPPAPGREAAAAYLDACARTPTPVAYGETLIREHSLLTVALALTTGFLLGRLIRR